MYFEKFKKKSFISVSNLLGFSGTSLEWVQRVHLHPLRFFNGCNDLWCQESPLETKSQISDESIDNNERKRAGFTVKQVCQK